MGVGKKLQELLAERRINPNELANKTGIPAQTIYSLIKRDATKMEIDSLIKICHALGINIEYFGDEEDEPSTIAAHFDGDEYTEDELEEIKRFAQYVKSNRK